MMAIGMVVMFAGYALANWGYNAFTNPTNNPPLWSVLFPFGQG